MAKNATLAAGNDFLNGGNPSPAVPGGSPSTTPPPSPCWCIGWVHMPLLVPDGVGECKTTTGCSYPPGIYKQEFLTNEGCWTTLAECKCPPDNRTAVTTRYIHANIYTHDRYMYANIDRYSDVRIIYI
jgi:hypothetical protein